jgi:UDP-hydrolysing UDP-N-acetyl-D-glucosamine 2-epimerase
MKICIPILSRQAFGRLEPLIRELDQSKHETIIIVGGAACISQYGDVRELLNYESQILYRPPDDSCGSMAFATGLALQELVPEFTRLAPDLIFAHADRYETLAVAIAASYSNIPLAHTQGGEHTGSIDDKVRYAVSHLSNYHFTATQKAAQNLLDQGLDNVFNVGCPSLDLARHVMNNADNVSHKDIIKMLNYYGTGMELKPEDDYVLIVYHPDTTMNRVDIQLELDKLYFTSKEHTSIWMLPNIDAGSEMISKRLRQYRDSQSPPIRFITHLPPNDYLHVMRLARFAVGNSSSFIREGSYMGIPAILVGNRQHHRELGPNILQSDHDLLTKKRSSSNLYGDGNASQKIVRFLDGL